MKNWEKQMDKDGYPDIDPCPCDMCEGKGWYWIANGPDDSEKEPCDCKAGEEAFNGKTTSNISEQK